MKMLIPALSLPKSASSINYVYHVRDKDFQDQYGRLGTLSAAEHELPSSWLGIVSEMFYLLLPDVNMLLQQKSAGYSRLNMFLHGACFLPANNLPKGDSGNLDIGNEESKTPATRLAIPSDSL